MAAEGNEEEELEELIEWKFEGKVDIGEGLTEYQLELVNKLLKDNKNMFAKEIKDLGECKLGKHKILLEDERPIYQMPYRRSLNDREIMKKEVEEMLKAGIIRPSKSPWSFQALIIPKKDGSKRFCIDYRKLNNVTKRDQFPMPRIEDILDRLQGAKWFSGLDLKSGYWQIPMDESSMEKTAFTTWDGHYEFLRLPFGLRNAPAEFNRLMKVCFADLPYVQVYLDDITVFSDSFEDHIEHLKTVMSRIAEAGLKLNEKKCQLFKRELHILGHVVSERGLFMEKKKLEAVDRFVEPRNVGELQTFLGLTGYYRKFVKDYAKMAHPLYKLLQKDAKWIWTNECQSAYKSLKGNLLAEPILRLPDFSKPFYVYTDASGTALGAVLGQKDEQGHDYVCQYASRSLRGAEVHYGITEKECLAVVWAAKLFYPYLSGRRFTVITDHAALKWLMEIKDPTGRLARWSIYLQSLDMEIQYRKGSLNTNADALSRPVYRVEVDVSSCRSIDELDDEPLLYFLKNKRHLNGLSKNKKVEIERKAARYTWENDSLWYWDETTTRYKQVPSKQERKHIIEKAHLLGHFGTDATVERIRETFYWTKIWKDTAAYVKGCLTCARHNCGRTGRRAGKTIEVTGFMDRIGMDLVLGLPETEDGYNGIIVITEYMTRFPWAAPIRSKSATEIAAKLFEFISIFGPPKEILSDNGKEFVNQVVDKMYQLTGIERKVTSPYKPSTNGLTERFNQTLVRMLSKHAEDDPTNWHKWIPYVLLSYRSKVQSTLDYSPYELMFGSKMNHFDCYAEIEGGEENEESSNWKRLKTLKELLHPSGLKTLNSAQPNEAQENFVQGDLVMVKTLGMKSKLTRKYHGPYEVQSTTKNGNYFLRNMKGNLLKRAYPPEHLKKVEAKAKVEETFYEVEEIEDHRVNQGKLEYLVKWKGYDRSENTWEREDNFVETECLDDYWNKLTRNESLNVEVESEPADLLVQRNSEALLAQSVECKAVIKGTGVRSPAESEFSRAFVGDIIIDNSRSNPISVGKGSEEHKYE